MKILRHKLKEEATFERTRNNSGRFRQSNLPDTIIIHYTAGGSAEGAVHTFMDPDFEVSAHVVVDFDGSLTQLLPFNMIGWHCGRSKWLDCTGINRYSIGIEIVNAGKLEKSGNAWRAWFGKTYPEEEVIRAVHRNQSEPAYWHRFTEEQIATVFELCKSLVKKYDIRFILGHEEISPGRKVDPGPAFPLDKLRDKVLHPNRKNDETTDTAEPEKEERGVVTAHALNIRSGPGVNHDKISTPLSHSTKVALVDEKEGWYLANTVMHGWASSKFIEKSKDIAHVSS